MPPSSSSFRTTTSPERLTVAGQDDVERLVEDDLVAACEVGDLDVGMQGDPHLAPAGEDVDGAVVVGTQVGAVRRRGLGQLLDLVAQVGDVLLGRLEGEGQLLVLGDGLGELTLGLEELLLERLDAAWALLQPAAQDGDLLLRGEGAGRERLEIPGRPPAVGLGRHRRNQPSQSPRSSELPCWRPYTWAPGRRRASPARSVSGRAVAVCGTDGPSAMGGIFRIALSVQWDRSPPPGPGSCRATRPRAERASRAGCTEGEPSDTEE